MPYFGHIVLLINFFWLFNFFFGFTIKFEGLELRDRHGMILEQLNTKL